MKALITGYGSIGKRYMEGLHRLGITDFVVFRRTEKDVPGYPEVKVFNRLDDALAARPDFAVISNPTNIHIPTAMQVANAGCHLFIDKPLSHNLDGIAELQRVVREKNLVVLVGYVLRFHAGLVKLRELLERGSIGKPLCVQVQVGQYLPDWRPGRDYRDVYSAHADRGGGVVLDLSHELDYLLWLFGPASHVSAVMGRTGELEIDAEDVADILLEHPGGVLSSVHMDYLQRAPVRNCRVAGSEGTLTWDYFSGTLGLFTSETKEWQYYSFGEEERGDMYLKELEHFVECVRLRAQTSIPLEAGLQVLQLVEAARKSAGSGERVEVGRVC